MSPWTEECVRLLDKLSKPKELTAQQIAERLSEHFGCRISRNAVMGKMSSLGINDRLVGRSPEYLRRKSLVSKTVHKETATKPIPSPSGARIGTSARDAIDALNPSDCRWPEGDPMSNNFRFCGHMRRIGYPYCEHHLSRAARRPVAGGEQ